MKRAASPRTPEKAEEKTEAHDTNTELARKLDELAQNLRGKVDPHELARIICEERKKR